MVVMGAWIYANLSAVIKIGKINTSQLLVVEVAWAYVHHADSLSVNLILRHKENTLAIIQRPSFAMNYALHFSLTDVGDKRSQCTSL